MGKIVNSTFASLDGVINQMDDWHGYGPVAKTLMRHDRLVLSHGEA